MPAAAAGVARPISDDRTARATMAVSATKRRELEIRRSGIALGTGDARAAGGAVRARVALGAGLACRSDLALGARSALGPLRTRGPGRTGLSHGARGPDRPLRAGRAGGTGGAGLPWLGFRTGGDGQEADQRGDDERGTHGCS